MLSTSQRNALNNLSPSLLAAGFAFGDVINQMQVDLASGNLGIGSDAADVDSLAKGGGNFSVDADNIAGLTFAYKAGRFLYRKAMVNVNAGTIALSASTTNYVEVDQGGTISKNTVGFTDGRLPLYTIVTGAAAIVTITPTKALMTLIGLGAITGELLSSAAARRAIGLGPVTVTATPGTAAFVLHAPVTGKLENLSISVSTTITADNVNYWTLTAVNKSNGNAAMLAVVDANTTKVAGGDLTANTARNLTLTATGANLNVNKGDVIWIVPTKASAAANLVDFTAQAEFSFTA